MLRFLYTVAIYLATPLIVWRLFARGFRYRDYFHRWRERFGHFPDPHLHDSIWVHAVSVGEVNAALPLIQSLRRRYAPRPLAVVMETEIWPNLFHQCGRRGIPLAVVNARLSERSLRGYAPIRPLVRQALRNVSLVAAQSHADARRYRALGAEPAHVSVAGNLKFDTPLPKGVRERGEELRASWGPSRPVWIAASTHEREELAV